MNIIISQSATRTARWAAGLLAESLGQKGFETQLDFEPVEGPGILAGLAGEGSIAEAMTAAGVVCPAKPESLVIKRLSEDCLLLAGRDEAGLVYALTETARAIELAEDGQNPFDAVIETVEEPLHSWRSMQLFLCNEALEREWYFDEHFWEEYFAELVRCRYNNFSLTFAHQTAYLAPPYPFLVELPELPEIRILAYSDQRRDENLQMLRKISEMAQERCIHFTFGVWSQHACDYGEAMLEGLDENNLADLNSIGLRKVLKACPAIDGVQFRMNDEAGIPEEQQLEYFEKQFRAVADCGRPIRLDIRAKGLSNDTIRQALDIVPSTVVSTKFWCEHIGMPYPMPAIQQFDVPNYRRYGSWDLLEKPRDWDLVYRLWSAGSQRIWLWGDPEWVRRFSDSCRHDSIGFEVMSPLTNKGALHTDGGQRIIEDRDVQPYENEFQRYWMFQLLFGRLGYNPSASPETWNRELRFRFGPAAEAVEQAYHFGSQIVPFITAALQWSASLWGFWAEMWAGRTLEEDIEIEPSDPTQLYGISEYVRDAVKGELSGKWTPAQIASHLKALSSKTLDALDAARMVNPQPAAAEFRGTELDFRMISHYADYHAQRILAGMHFAFFKRTGDSARLPVALHHLEIAKDEWASLAGLADGVYHRDLVFGRPSSGHVGHWMEKFYIIENDIARIRELSDETPGDTFQPKCYPGEEASFERPAIHFEPPLSASAGNDFMLELCVDDEMFCSVRCFYRNANQALDFDSLEMLKNENTFTVSIPGNEITECWDLMLFFEVRLDSGEAFRWPDWRERTPYFVVETEAPQSTSTSSNSSITS